MIVTLTFGFPLNTSLSVGDTVYYQTPVVQSGFNTSNVAQNLLGTITSIDWINNSMQVDSDNQVAITTADFISFTKDNAVELASVVGYYAEVKMVNNDHGDGSTLNDQNVPSELFSVGVDVFESSK